MGGGQHNLGAPNSFAGDGEELGSVGYRCVLSFVLMGGLITMNDESKSKPKSRPTVHVTACKPWFEHTSLVGCAYPQGPTQGLVSVEGVVRPVLTCCTACCTAWCMLVCTAAGTAAGG